jgi:hypothetical protein
MARPTGVMREIVDNQLETADGHSVGRVADIEAELRADGSLVLVSLVIGPEALAGRVASHLRPIAQRIFGGRFEHHIPIGDVKSFGPTLKLKHPLSHYDLGKADDWIAEHLFKFIPGRGTTSKTGTEPPAPAHPVSRRDGKS